MKKISITFAAVALAGSLMAQENRLSAGLEVAFPMGDWSDFVGIGVGGSLGFELPVGDNLGLMAQAGYIRFMGKTYEPIPGFEVETDGSGVVPIQVGAKYYFSENQAGAYLGVLTGLHMVAQTVAGADGSEETETDSNFGVAPLLGFIVGENIDIGLRYQLLFAKGADETTGEETTVTNGYLGLRAAYMF